MVADGGRMPVGLGNLDEAVETSLFIDRSDGVGDGARASAAPDVVDSLIFSSLYLDFFYVYKYIGKSNSIVSLDNTLEVDSTRIPANIS